MATPVAHNLAERYRALRRMVLAFRPARVARTAKRKPAFRPPAERGAETGLYLYLQRRLSGRSHEALLCLFYGADGEFRSEAVIGGCAEFVRADRSLLMRSALQHGAHHVVIAHNHPGGDPRPSVQDVEGTRALHRMFAALGMRLHDHAIVGGEGALFSFRRAGLM